ncbi:hypothetical protein HDU97_006683 [Phlyctochytrium planicorne]|nr:hypothetical protein HDU97_006683 [Phlyctochytrium planicorne]
MGKGKKAPQQKLSLQEFQSRGGSASNATAAPKPVPAKALENEPTKPNPVISHPALAPHPAALKAAALAADDDDGEEVCHICTDPISYYSVGECNHRICHLCSLRLRALLKDQACPLCKTALPKVVFTSDAEKPFADYDLRTFSKMDKRLSIYFDGSGVHEDVMILLRFNCPDSECDVACPDGWGELKRHVQAAHGKSLCDLCTRHQKLFTHEHALYTQSDLQKHMDGKDPSDKSFKGHPKCGFCNKHFYGNDELYEHCRQNHEQCFLCTQAGVRHQYYKNYNQLESHFRSDHFACLEPECLEKKFQVFATDIDFKAHEMECHPHKRTRGSKGERLDITFQVAGGPNSKDRFRDDRGRNRGGSSGPSGSGSTSEPLSTRTQEESLVSNSPALTPRVIPGYHPPSPPTTSSNLNSSSTARTGSQWNRAPEPRNVEEEFPLPAPSATVQRDPPPVAKPPVDTSEVVVKLQILFDSDEEKFKEFKSLSTGFRQSRIDADTFCLKFMDLALSGITESNIKQARLLAFNVWNRLTETAPDDPVDPKLKWGNVRPKGRKEQMLEALNNYKAKHNHSTPSVAFPAMSSYAKPTSLESIQRNDASSSSSSARILVIKSKASKQKIHAGSGSSSGWGNQSDGRGFVASFEGLITSSTPTPAAVPTPVAPVTVAPIVSLMKNTAGPGPSLPRSDFPGLPKAAPKVERYRKETASNASVWGDSHKDNAEDNVETGKGGKKKKGKEVLLKFG